MGVNGCGKSALLAVLGNREVPIQDHIDIYYLAREIPASEKTALEAVMEADEERMKLEALAEQLATQEDDESQEFLMQVYDRLDDMGADTAESRAAHLLMGLQFTDIMQVWAEKFRNHVFKSVHFRKRNVRISLEDGE